MPEHSIGASCSAHGTNKPIQNGWETGFGKQGLGMKGPTQLLFVFHQLRKAVKSEVQLSGMQDMTQTHV